MTRAGVAAEARVRAATGVRAVVFLAAGAALDFFAVFLAGLAAAFLALVGMIRWSLFGIS
jgi:hypothetical protein